TLTTTNATATAVQLIDATTAALGTITAASGRVVLGAISVGDDLSGAVSQNGALVLTAGELSVLSGGSVTLTNNNLIGTLLSVSRGGAFSLTDTAGGLVVTGPVTAGTTASAVTISTAGGTLAVNGAITTTGANNVALRGVGITLASATTVAPGAGTAT